MRILEALKELGDDESLLIQSGKPVGVFKTHADAPRVLIANSNLVPRWATWEHFNELDRKGLMMYGQMTAGSWIYIGSQGIVQGTYETFAEAGRQHFGGDLGGKLDPDRGTRRHGRRAAARGDDGRCVDARRRVPAVAHRRCALRTRYLDVQASDLDDALALIDAALRAREGRVASGLLGNAADILPELATAQAGGCGRDLVTDQTSAHDLVNGYLPAGWTRRALAARRSGPRAARVADVPPPQQSIVPCTCARCSHFHAHGHSHVRLRQQHPAGRARRGRRRSRSHFPGFVPAYIRPLFCEGKGPFRWVALSGDPEDIHATDAKIKQLFPQNAHLHRWLDMARERIAFQGLPARICWLGLGERHRAGSRSTRWCKRAS